MHLTLRLLDRGEPSRGRAATVPQAPRPEPPGPQPDGPYRHVLTRILEALDGRRPVSQLRGLLSDPVFEATLTRLRTTPPKAVRYQLQSVHSCRVAPNAVELCARVEVVRTRERRSIALTARLEHRFDSWQCVFLRLLQC